MTTISPLKMQPGGLSITRLSALGLMVGACLLSAAAFAQSTASGSTSAEWAKVLAAAKKEGKVVLYTSQVVAVAERMAPAFRKAHPDIALEWSRNTSGVVLTKVEQERAAGIDGADVLVTTEQAWLQERGKEGSLLRAGNPARNWPAAYVVSEGTAFIGGVEPMTIVYNKNLVAVPPKGYADLLRPELKGRIGAIELSSTFMVSWYDVLEKSLGTEFLTRLRAQNPKMYAATSVLVQSLASGELAMGMGNVTGTMPLMEKGAPLGFILPSPSVGVAYGMAALGWSKRPNAALVLLDYFMSVEGQTVWHGRGEGASPLPNIPGSLPIAEARPWNPAAYPPEVASKYRQHWDRIFK